MYNTSKIMSLLAASILLPASATASLIDRGDGLIYDDVLNITWLQDANYAFTSGFSSSNANGYSILADGKMNWQAAQKWADNLIFGGFDDWRLPSILPLNGSSYSYLYNAKDGSGDYGYNITSTQSELAYMSNVNLGLESIFTPSDTANPDWIFYNDVIIPGTGPIQNLKSYTYWSGAQDTLEPSHAWQYSTMIGLQTESRKTDLFYAWAVRDGDVAGSSPTAVSEPKHLAIFGILLIALTSLRRKPA